MSDLILVAFDDEDEAEEVRKLLFAMQERYRLNLEDAVVVVKNKAGGISINQTYNLVTSSTGGGMLYGSLWGLLIRALFFNPLLEWATEGVAGGTVGGVSGWLMDIGIDDDFIKKLGNTIQPGNSALFILTKKVTADKVVNELKSHGVEGTMLQTSLSIDDETRLQEILHSKIQ